MIIFRNPGKIDIRALKTFGLSSKEGQDKIGRFGTGLKYATAVIMRGGGEITVNTGGEEFIIGREADEFRGREITNLTINGDPLPFTTDLGRDWEPWMAFRELYSNALDEGGDVARAEQAQSACGDETVISVKMDAFEAIYFSMEEHFIGRDEAPLWKSDNIEVYQGRSAFVFYRGIAVMRLKKPSAFRYNLLGYLDLTEDRTAKYSWYVLNCIASALAKTDDEKIASVAADQRNEFEAGLDFSEYDPSETFLGSTVALGNYSNPTAMALVRAQIPADASEATIVQKGSPGAECLMNALRVLRAIGADLSKCKFVLAEGIKFYGDFEVRNGAVFINQSIFENQEKMTLAVVEGYAEVVGKNWMARRLITMAEHEGEKA